jgi:DNA-binding response OmpR family regulator
LTQPRGTVLSISGFEEDQLTLGHIFRSTHWKLVPTRSCEEAAAYLRVSAPPVVICETNLPDGTWKDLLGVLTRLEYEPGLIVSSRTADDYLWAEVLNLGGCDVLAKPFDAREVLWAATMAWNEWRTRLSRRTQVARV